MANFSIFLGVDTVLALFIGLYFAYVASQVVVRFPYAFVFLLHSSEFSLPGHKRINKIVKVLQAQILRNFLEILINLLKFLRLVLELLRNFIEFLKNFLEFL